MSGGNRPYARFALRLPPITVSTPLMGDRSRVSRVNRSVAQTVSNPHLRKMTGSTNC
jgi:hypothetical protein